MTNGKRVVGRCGPKKTAGRLADKDSCLPKFFGEESRTPVVRFQLNTQHARLALLLSIKSTKNMMKTYCLEQVIRSEPSKIQFGGIFCCCCCFGMDHQEMKKSGKFHLRNDQLALQLLFFLQKKNVGYARLLNESRSPTA